MFQMTDQDLRRFWSKVSLPDTGGCQPWLAGRFKDGYGSFGLQGRGSVRASRVACYIAHGDAPTGRPFVLHSCRTKHCVAPDHLEWGSPKRNQEDRRRDGTANVGESNPASKLTVDQVREIKRGLTDGISWSRLAETYDVSRGAIQEIAAGRNWGWV